MKLEVFFDYSCPYCLRGHEYLMELLPEFPHIEVVWRPCEAHPRPDRYGLHSDLCIQGLLYVMEIGADESAYHDAMYKAACADRANIEDASVLARYAGGVVDPAKLEAAVQSADYASVRACNVYAFEKNGVWAVPSYRMGSKKLDSIENVGVTKEQLRSFLASGV